MIQNAVNAELEIQYPWSEEKHWQIPGEESLNLKNFLWLKMQKLEPGY